MWNWPLPLSIRSSDVDKFRSCPDPELILVSRRLSEFSARVTPLSRSKVAIRTFWDRFFFYWWSRIYGRNHPLSAQAAPMPCTNRVKEYITWVEFNLRIFFWGEVSYWLTLDPYLHRSRSFRPPNFIAIQLRLVWFLVNSCILKIRFAPFWIISLSLCWHFCVLLLLLKKLSITVLRLLSFRLYVILQYFVTNFRVLFPGL